MATTTILDFELPANSHSGANQNRRPGVPAYLEQVVYAAVADPDSPGASWIIDRDRPRDPLDPGPFGSPDWRPDNRTGRHRRGELPDPPRDAEPAQPRSERANRPSPGPTSEGAEGRRLSPGHGGDEPPEPPVRPRRRFWEEDPEDRYDFGKLREDAWTRFIAGSQELHHAHLVAKTTFADRWFQFWVAMRAFLFRMFGIGSAEAPPVVEGPTMPLRIVPTTVKPSQHSLLGGTPSQGAQRTNPISPFLGNWERHFDERQAFREAVAL